MKKSYIFGALALAATLSSCDDFLNDNRYPLTSIVDSPTYWESSDNVQLQVDRFYTNFSGYGAGGSLGWFYAKTLSDDQVGSNFAQWTYTSVPSSDGEYSFSLIRGCNQVIVNVRKSTGLTEKEKKNFEGIARLNRAYEYYQMVRKYGDITWESGIVDINDNDILYGERTDRDIVMDSVLNDINYAIAAISTESAKQAWSQDLARAIKSEICLYEGTYCKYRTAAENGKAADPERAKKFLQASAEASEALMGKYEFTNNYHALYNSVYDGDELLGALSKNSEVIFMKAYNSVTFTQSTISYTASSTPTSGISKDAFDSFLFKDGKPLALTTMDKSDVGVGYVDGEVYDGPIPYVVAEGDTKTHSFAYYIGDVLKVRDARLSVITDPYVCYTNMTWSRAGTTGIASSSGYTVAKFDNVNLPVTARQNSNQNYTCAPIYWISYIYCNYAEAKAELDQFTQAEFDKSIGKLYQRAELPITTVAQLENMNDPANNMGVSSLLWEIRRCRRNELMLDNWIRYWDLVRWHQLELLDTQKHPNVILGANITKSPIQIDNVDGYVNGAKGQSRVYDAKYYFYPIPTNQINLTNGAIKQNPHW